MPVVPVLLPGAASDALAEVELERFQAVDLRRADDDSALERLHQAVRACLEPAPEVEASSRAPYSGIEARTEQDADLFFGRDRLVAEIVEALGQRPVVSLIGPSGSGKTSLVAAGVIPRLRRDDAQGTWEVLRVRCRSVPADDAVAIRYHHPGRNADLTLTELAALIAAGAQAQPPPRRLLMLDDLDELTEVPEWQDEARRLSEILRRAQTTPGFHALLIARSDAVPDLRSVSSLGALLDAHPLRVETMADTQLRRAIEGPVQRVGATFEPGLVDRILKEMEGEPEALALMQGLLQELWIRRRNGWLTNQAFDELGGIAGVAARRAEALYQRLDEPDREAMRHLMLGLVRIGPGGEHGRRRMPLSALIPSDMDAGTAAGAGYRALAERLVEEHLLIARATDSGHRAVEPAHDGLITDWPRLWNWLQENREFLQWRDRLADAANAWDQAGRPGNMLLRGGDLARARDWREERAADLSALQETYIQRSTQRRTRGTAVSIALLSIVALITSGFALLAWQQREIAVEQRSLAVQQAREAESAQATAELLRETEAAARQAAEARGEQLQAEVESLQGRVEETSRYVQELEQRSERLADRAQLAEIEEQRAAWEARARQAQESEARLREALEKLRTDVVQAAPGARSEVDVHYSSGGQRAAVVHLARTLQAEGIRVPSLELTEPVKRSQLRYFSKDEDTVAQAKWLVKLLKSKQRVSDLVARYVRPGKAAAPDRFELWLSPAFAAKAD
jgi:flagellar biosynthesis GTPase FlhF